ncbi:Patatin-like phospholipase [Clostridiaceae bacterium BL-3]|nr:Patatin-like phospholipase [Clostridiaceae bacterium BL-3]
MKADAVFEGGGIKGIGLIGAVCYFEKMGYRWNRFAGTSAGAIIASLLAVGYTGEELKNIMMNLDEKMFLKKKDIWKISMIKKTISLFKDKGIYSTGAIEKYIEELLLKKGKVTFGDISTDNKSPLKIIASDVTKKSMLILPDDLVNYGINPMKFKIAEAVRMSISIPLYFKPLKLYYGNKYSYIVDGGLLSNFPIWIFDTKDIPAWPTIGFKLTEKNVNHNESKKMDFISYLFDIIGTIFDKNEEVYVKDKYAVRTVFIPTLGVKTTEFNISRDMRLKLFESGYKSAQRFLHLWDFDNYIREYVVEK